VAFVTFVFVRDRVFVRRQRRCDDVSLGPAFLA